MKRAVSTLIQRLSDKSYIQRNTTRSSTYSSAEISPTISANCKTRRIHVRYLALRVISHASASATIATSTPTIIRRSAITVQHSHSKRMQMQIGFRNVVRVLKTGVFPAFLMHKQFAQQAVVQRMAGFIRFERADDRMTEQI